MDYKNSIESVAEGEEYLYTIRKHPFGIIILYVQAIVGLVGAFGLILFLLPQFVAETSRSRYTSLLALAMVLVGGLVALFLLLATYIYRQNKLIVTDKNITQVIQNGLFNRKVSELSLANVEDVTAQQQGIFATIFGYGELRVETAGEQNNFHFSYCPNSNYCGKIILDARQKYISHDPGVAQRANERLDVPGSYS
jgi:uncharacterized membrane protein YdbT with pleckstrin-like domain